MFRVPILSQKVANTSFYSSPRPLKTNDYMTEQNVLRLKKVSSIYLEPDYWQTISWLCTKNKPPLL